MPLVHSLILFKINILKTLLNCKFEIITLSSGVQILIFLAAIQTVPSSIYEAANIDGATPWETFWKITLPYLSPMILVNSIYTIIDQLGSNNNNVIRDI
jgi:ABC-type sugar transport system permease subunit